MSTLGHSSQMLCLFYQVEKSQEKPKLKVKASCRKACRTIQQIPSLIKADLQKTSTTYIVFDIFKSKKLLMFLLVSIYTW